MEAHWSKVFICIAPSNHNSHKKCQRSTISSVQLLSRVGLLATPWTTACQTSLSNTSSWSLLKLVSIESVMPSNHLICHPSPSPPAFNLSQHQGLFQWISSSNQVARVLEFHLQHQSFQWIFKIDFFLISLQSKRLSRVFSTTTVQKHQFFGTQLSSQSNSDIHTWILKNHSFD